MRRERNGTPRVFDRFYRGENARFCSGMGLGLSIAQRIAEQHGGKISVESTPGQGSRFMVILPLLNQMEMQVSEADLGQALGL